MKKTIPILILMLSLLTICVLATDNENNITSVTFTTPASSGYVQGTYSFTGSYGTGRNSTGNISVYYNASVDNPAAFLCADTTLGTKGAGWSCSVATSTFTDDCSGHTIYALYFNGTDGGRANNTVNGTQTTVKFDNTAGTISSITFDQSTIRSRDRITYTAKATDTCDSSLTYGFVVTKPRSGGTVTKTSSSTSLSQGDTEEQGSYTSVLTITDDAGNTATDSSATFRVDGTRDGVELLTEKPSVIERITTTTSYMWFLMGGLILIVVAGSIALLLFMQSKKGSRRRRRR